MSCHTSPFMTLLAGSMSNDQLAAAINETKQAIRMFEDDLKDRNSMSCMLNGQGVEPEGVCYAGHVTTKNVADVRTGAI